MGGEETSGEEAGGEAAGGDADGDGGDRRAPTAIAPAELARRLSRYGRLRLFLDYDGTLVGFASRPELAVPDESLVSLLAALAARPSTEVHVLSGRDAPTLERFFGALPLWLHGEHGFWSRPNRQGAPWRPIADVDEGWKPTVRAALTPWLMRVPGAHIEEKPSSLVWHYRAAHDPAAARAAGATIEAELRAAIAELPVELMPGNCVVEVRPRGASKGAAVSRVVAAASAGWHDAAFGDDTSDEEMFAALPPGGTAVHVGDTPTRAAYVMGSADEVRATLTALLGTGREASNAS